MVVAQLLPDESTLLHGNCFALDVTLTHTSGVFSGVCEVDAVLRWIIFLHIYRRTDPPNPRPPMAPDMLVDNFVVPLPIWTPVHTNACGYRVTSGSLVLLFPPSEPLAVSRQARLPWWEWDE